MGIALEIEDFGVRCQIDQMGAAVQHHVREKVGLVNLTSLGAGNSDPDGHLVIDKIGEIVVGAVPRGRFQIEIPVRIGPHDAAVDQE
jgi:hypothetical protein